MLKDILKDHHIILASGSPRRQQFLNDLDITYEIRLKKVDEVYNPDLQHHEIPDYLAELKAKPYLEELEDHDILITSDTVVWHNNVALGKPKDYNQAFEMIQSLSGTSHEVITSVCFTTKKSQKTVHAITTVSFKNLSSEEINYYIKTYEPFDKAGAYGIQEWIGQIGITKIEGSYFNVVGLPLHLVYQTLKEIVAS
ncbi:Maf-like protein [Zhouia sp. PK063]|uniref:Maf-like protein n=1 Tax=Zhouia sp. PK063 TaxID=3373602 RepID=UPI0037A8C18F